MERLRRAVSLIFFPIRQPIIASSISSVPSDRFLQTPLAALPALSNRSLRALRFLRPLSIFVPERQEKL